MRRHLAFFVVATSLAAVSAAGQRPLPNRLDSLKFAVIGDNGTGAKPQYEVAERMALAREGFPFELVLMLGDNLYGRQQPQDFVDEFERPYAPLLQVGVRFYAAIGNHDDGANQFYQHFIMGGARYYTYARKNVRFFALDSNLMDPKQLAWIDSAVTQSKEEWKIAYFHHPLYSDGGRHGSNLELRVMLEPLFIRHGVDVVFSGHEHVYARSTPQKGITYFVEGSSGQLRKGNMRSDATVTAASFDQDQTFMLVEIAGGEMTFQALSRAGHIVDAGVIQHRARE